MNRDAAKSVTLDQTQYSLVEQQKVLENTKSTSEKNNCKYNSVLSTLSSKVNNIDQSNSDITTDTSNVETEEMVSSSNVFGNDAADIVFVFNYVFNLSVLYILCLCLLCHMSIIIIIIFLCNNVIVNL